jgi:hypothetical protein
MKFFFTLGALYLALIGAANAQSAPTPGDIVIPGSNAWAISTPDDGSTTMYFFPWINGAWNRDFRFSFYNNGDTRFRGKMNIGNQNPQTQQDFRLAVEGKLVAQAVCVTSPSNWADFVFAPTYQPMSLPNLEAYLWRNKHLPAIPSASEVEAHGYSLSDMDAKLLQSIEELTLHVIALNKRVAQLEAKKAAATK